MKNVKKIVLFSFMFLFVFAFTFGLANRTEAASGCSAVASGDWSVGAIWNCDVGGARVPTADDAVYITNYVVTIPTGYAAEALSVGINNDSAPAGITIAGSGTLSSSQNVVLGAPAGGINNTLSVGTGILIVKDGLVITGGGALGASEVTVSTGTIHVDNSVSFVGDMSTAKLTSTGTSSIYVGGNFGLTNMGTFDGTGSTLFLDGATSQILGASTGYNHVYVANTSGGVILSPGTTTINGTLQIFYSLGSTAFDIADADLTVLGATSIGADASLIVSSTTGTKTFTGDVDVLTGGYWNE